MLVLDESHRDPFCARSRPNRDATNGSLPEPGRECGASDGSLDQSWDRRRHGELAKREADLASLEAKKRHLDDLTALSTITAVLLAECAGGVQRRFGDRLSGRPQDRVEDFVASLDVLLTILGALLPWLVALGVPVLEVMWLVGRFGQRGRPGEALSRASAASPAPPE